MKRSTSTLFAFALFASLGCNLPPLSQGATSPDLISPNGVYQYTLYQALSKAMTALQVNRFSGNKVSISVADTANKHAAGIVSDLADRMTGKPNKGAQSVNLKFHVHVASVHQYRGFFFDNYEALALVNLTEKRGDQKRHYTSKLITYSYEETILNDSVRVVIWMTGIGFFVGTWGIIIAFMLYLAYIRFLNRQNAEE